MNNFVRDSPAHGGQIERLARQHNFETTDLLDFSANINPAPPPARVLARLASDARDITLLTRYPDLELHELRGAIAAQCEVEKSNITIANGSAALIDAALRAAAPRKCLLPVPAFSEYARALHACGCEIINYPLSEENDFRLDAADFARQIELTGADFCIVNNPHNPSGALVSRENLKILANTAHAFKTIVLLDEAFIDYQPDESLTELANQLQNLIVTRSVTKFYSIPSLRVGYAVSDENLARKMNAQIPSWAVTTLAANAVSEIYKDENFAAQTIEQNAVERDYLRESLTRIGAKVYPSAANFLLLNFERTRLSAAQLCERLLVNHKIVVRDCSSYENLDNRFMRVAVRARNDNEQLVSAVVQCLS